LLGTDDLGRDVLSRILAGAGSILTVAPAATVLCITAGTVLGLVAGYYRGLLDDVLMRAVDAVISLPAIVVGVFVLGLLGPSTLNLVFVIGIIFTPFVSRTVRSTVLVERERSYVEAAQLRGERGLYVMFADILPNITGPIAVEATVRFGFAVFTASSLSFLGLGLQRPSPDWGLTIALEQVFIQVAPWTDLAPAAALASLLVGVYLLADSLQRVLEE
jgi:peptide/nickel transport system permease protein